MRDHGVLTKKVHGAWYAWFECRWGVFVGRTKQEAIEKLLKDTKKRIPAENAWFHRLSRVLRGRRTRDPRMIEAVRSINDMERRLDTAWYSNRTPSQHGD